MGRLSWDPPQRVSSVAFSCPVFHWYACDSAIDFLCCIGMLEMDSVHKKRNKMWKLSPSKNIWITTPLTHHMLQQVRGFSWIPHFQTALGCYHFISPVSATVLEWGRWQTCATCIVCHSLLGGYFCKFFRQGFFFLWVICVEHLIIHVFLYEWYMVLV